MHATKLICPPLQGLMLMDGWYLRNMSCIQKKKKKELSGSPGREGFDRRCDFYRGEYYTFLERSECIKMHNSKSWLCASTCQPHNYLSDFYYVPGHVSPIKAID